MIALYALAAVAAASSPVHLECPLNDASGSPVLWQITLDEAAGAADVTIGYLDPVRLPATFYPTSVRFYVGGDMRMDLSRTDLRIARYSNGESQAPNYGQCKIVKAKGLAF